MKTRPIRIMISALALILLLLTASCAAAAGDELTVKAAGSVRGYTDNMLIVTAPAAGTLTLVVSDEYNVYRTMRFQAAAGRQELVWDGLSDSGKRVGQYNGTYQIRGTLISESGQEWSAESSISVLGSRQTLLLALPSSDVLYLGGGEKWFVELQTVRQGEGRVVMQVCRAEAPDQPVLTQSIAIADEVSFRFYWKGKKRDALGPGDYILTFWSDKNSRIRRSFPVRMEEGEAPRLPVAPTGPVLPSPGMSDDEIWALMQKPSVVVNIRDVAHQEVFEGPDSKSASLGTLHGETQALEVLEEPENGWVKIRAWRHEDNRQITGYVPLAALKVVKPHGPYGVLVDKETQTLILFENGTRLAVLPVSTGLPVPAAPERETTSGAFLTSEHIGDFISERRHYSDVIRYDGGNLIHSAGHRRDGRHCDFTEQLSLLGQKASHGCVRVPPLPYGETGICSWWLYTHLPYHTRVMIVESLSAAAPES